jgi:tRNA threonylcarbamoyladenosine biosynthesis protein TsaB
MKVLGIETSTMTGSIALVEEEKLIAEYTLNLGQTHSTRLMPAIDRILKDSNLTIEEIEGIAVALGPGSFTGLRIGIATAKALAQGLGKPIVGIPTLDGLARNLLPGKQVICPLLDARKREIYFALYESKDDKLKRLTDYLSLKPGELLKMINTQQPAIDNQPIYFLGNGTFLYKDLLKKNLGKRALFISGANNFPRGANIALLGLKKLAREKPGKLFSLKPLYIRHPDVTHKN